MREMRDSGAEWIGEVPADWKVVPIKANVSIGHGSDPELSGDTPVWGSGSEPFKTCGEYKEGPTVLLGRKGTLDCPQLVMGHYWNVDTAFDAKIKDESLSLKFFYYVATCVDIKLYMTNTAKPSMTQSDWGNSRIPLPPMLEQRHIVSYLDERCAAIDEDVAKRREVIEKLKEYKKALVAHVVTKGLDPNVEMRDSGVEWIGEVPADWEIHYPKALFFMRNERMKPGDTQLTASQEYGVIPQSEFQEKEGRRVVQVILNPNILKHVEVGDFVMHMRSFQGGLELADQPGCVSSAYVMLHRRINKARDNFFKYIFKSSAYIDALRSTSNLIRDGQALRFANFVQVYLPLPSIEEQDRIAAYLDERCAAVDETISRQEQLIEKLGEYRKSIIHHAVTGKTDCTEAAK